jgi:photosystem II stability/assembly factor-like uncharacterized protein
MQWRISPSGALQRAIEITPAKASPAESPRGEWQNVLSPANVRFHAVAVVGENVWAGGSQASLFHSRDGGARWEQVNLPTGGSPDSPQQTQQPRLSGAPAPTITRIEFEDARHGSVEADDGTTWLTSDGGHSWTIR